MAIVDLTAPVEAQRARRELPALGAAVWRGAELIAIGVSGVRKDGAPITVTATDAWHLGSCTKAMTGTLIGVHVDRGELSFDDTLETLMPGETIHGGYRSVTVMQLLQHRGGAPGDVPRAIWEEMWRDGASPDARAKAVRAMLALPPAQAAGTFVYSNAGYMIAGFALEVLTGKSWEMLMNEDLFAPLGMASCGFGAPASVGATDAPWGHIIQNARIVPIEPGPTGDNPPSLGPAGTVHCSMADWGKFLAVHLAGARGEPALISADAIARLQTPPRRGDYAGGWGVGERPWADGLVLTHSGTNTNWFATTWLAPVRNTTMVVVTNIGGDDAAVAVDEMFGPLIEMFLP